ncbi:hypothetical protein FB567DRAFT_549488 [Paraphoma chrysanthemicola]|uniref:Uncharacterized protein n=1 Tax=Paraphoma chrysanthemicola TaxID=798071 RepID=A0A8K0R713_9PLEO|nr:hypothetical protein FB567DRAFT_549488 [Paraphoma chrysanthemicola]
MSVDSIGREETYGTTLGHLADELGQIQHHGEHFLTHSLGSTFTILLIIEDNVSISHRELVRKVCKKSPDVPEGVIHCLIELSVRMWLTVNVRAQHMFMRPLSAGDELLDWAEEVSLEQLLNRRFERHAPRQSPQQELSAARFDPAFTAVFLATNRQGCPIGASILEEMLDTMGPPFSAFQACDQSPPAKREPKVYLWSWVL